MKLLRAYLTAVWQAVLDEVGKSVHAYQLAGESPLAATMLRQFIETLTVSAEKPEIEGGEAKLREVALLVSTRAKDMALLSGSNL